MKLAGDYVIPLAVANFLCFPFFFSVSSSASSFFTLLANAVLFSYSSL